MSDYKELCERLMDTCVEDLHGYAAVKVGQLLGEVAEALEALQARVAAAEDALASDPVLTDKDLCAAVIVCVMSGEQARRDEACLKLQRHISAVERERDCLETECEHLSDRAHMAEHELSARRSENDALRAKLEALEAHKAAAPRRGILGHSKKAGERKRAQVVDFGG